MSTQINVTIGDQRLLQTNKARTAANQQNLDARLLAKQTEEKAAPLVEAQRAEEERPGSIPVRRIPRRPAAQRQLQETALLFYDFLRPRTVEGSNQSIANRGPITVNTVKWSSTLQNYVAATALFTLTSNQLPDFRYETTQSQPTVYVYGPLKENVEAGNVLEPVSSEVGNAYTIYYNVRNSFAWLKQRSSVLRIGVGAPSNQTFVDSFSAFPVPYFSSQVGFETAVHSSTAKFTFVSYLLRYNRHTVSEIAGPYLPYGTSVPNYTAPVSATDTFVVTTTLTTYLVGVYVTTSHTTGLSTYRTVELDSTDTNFTYPDFFSAKNFEPKFTGVIPFTEQQQIDFIANMDSADPRRAIYQQTSRLDYALDTVINGCMYNPQTGGAYATGFDSEGKKVIVAKGTLERNLDYYTALLVRTKPAAAAIKNSVADQVPAQLPAEFSIYSQFTNTVGTDPLYGPGDLGRMFVAYGT